MPETSPHHKPITLPEYNVPPETLGIGVVEANERALAHSIDADRHRENWAKVALIEQKTDPIELSVPRQIGAIVLRKPLMTRKERQFRHQTYNSGREVIADYYDGLSLSLKETEEGRLKRVRETLQGLTFEQKQLAGILLYNLEAPAFIFDGFADHKKSHPDSNFIDWVSDAERQPILLNLLQWNADFTEKRNNNPALKEFIATEKRDYSQKVTELIDLGWLPEAARTKVETVDSTKVVLADLFDTIILNTADGYHVRGSDRIVISPGNKNKTASHVKKLQVTLKHELNHATLGSFTDRWLDEAVTEHLAEVMRSGRPEVIEPMSRKWDKNVYVQERRLLNVLLKKGKSEINPRSVLHAYASPLAGGSPERNRLGKKLDESWGVENTLNWLSVRIGKLEQDKAKSGKPFIQAQSEALHQVTLELIGDPGAIFDAKRVFEQQKTTPR